MFIRVLCIFVQWVSECYFARDTLHIGLFNTENGGEATTS